MSSPNDPCEGGLMDRRGPLLLRRRLLLGALGPQLRQGLALQFQVPGGRRELWAEPVPYMGEAAPRSHEHPDVSLGEVGGIGRLTHGGLAAGSR